MLSTYASYQLITRDIDRSIGRVEKQPVTARETEYYLKNITKVKSIEDFVGNYRLFAYAMKAFGLEDMIYAKAFMAKVLEGGVTDPDSFANRLNDKRYLEFAKAFDFQKNGENAITYNRAQVDVPRNFMFQVELTTAQDNYAYVEEETSYFLERIGGVTSIDGLIADNRLLTYAMAANGLYDTDYAPEYIRQMLEGGVTDPDSPANRLVDKRFANFVGDFNFIEFGADTTLRAAVQTRTPQKYIDQSGMNLFKGISDAQRSEMEYFAANIGKVTSVAQLMSDKRLLTFAMSAYGLDARTEPPERVRAMLVGGVSDPGSPANQLSDKRYAAFVTAFNFAEYGAGTTGRDAVSQITPQRYLEAQSDPETAYFRANISQVKSVGELLLDKRLLTYAMKALGLDASKESPVVIRDMLLGGTTDPDSPANKATSQGWRDFVGVFNFAELGADATAQPAVTEFVPALYNENLDAETAYFRANIRNVKSVDKLLADDRLLSYAMAAYGLDSSTQDKEYIRKMLVGGVDSILSPANLLEDRSYARFVSAFNFNEYGADTTSRPEVLYGTASRYDTMRDLGLVKLPAAYVKAETAYYTENVGKLQSIDDLMADKRILDYALAAYGFDPSGISTSTVRTMLEGGIVDDGSPANSSGDSRWQAFVSAFNFEQYGETTTTFSAALKPVVDKYMRQTLEENAGKDNEGVRLALYFERKAPDITNFYAILADPALAKVVRTVLSLPDSFANTDVDRQVKFFESKLNIEDLQDPAELKKLMTRFTSLWEISNGTSSTPTSLAASLIMPSTGTYGVSQDTLFAIQTMRR